MNKPTLYKKVEIGQAVNRPTENLSTLELSKVNEIVVKFTELFKLKHL